MASLVDELNELMARERGEAEALNAFIDSVTNTDPDIADGAGDALETATWACSGLYHRISQLHGTANLDSADLAQRISDEGDMKARLEMLCSWQKQDMHSIRAVLKRDDVDEATRSFLDDLLKAHQASAEWCVSTLDEWRVDVKR